MRGVYQWRRGLVLAGIYLVICCGSAAAQKSTSAKSGEIPEHFMRRVLKIANGTQAIDIRDMSESVYSAAFLDAMFGEGCFTAHRICEVDHLMWARICGCRYFPEDVKKKGDPLCGCPARPTFSGLSVVQMNPNNAEVSALLDLGPSGQSKVSWHLILTPEGWRIDDVTTSDFPSLKALWRKPN
ncbi:MAG: hypothetical protein WA294_14525 [Acidobacteriaceae bacterium]